ncbi:fibronectin type III domain-containing protein [Actinomadura welshii]
MRQRVLSNVPVAASATQTIKVTGVGAVPAGGVSMVAVNVVAKGADADGGLIVYPSDLSSPPAVTGSRYYARTFTDHVLMTKVGADGQVKLRNTGSTTANVYVDIHGYITGAATATGAGYVPLDTSRIVSNLNVAANSSASFSAVGAGAVPADGVSQVAMTLTVRSVGSGQAIVHPSGTAVPTGSNINYRPSDFLSNLAIVAPGEDGKITITNRGASNLRVYADVAGYFAAAPEADVAASSQVPVNPARIVNEVTVASGATYEVAPLGKGGVPASGVSGVGVTLTSRASAVGLLRVYPTGQTSIPSGGSVAYQTGVPWANFVPVKLGSDGTFTVKNMGSAAVTLSVDAFAYFKPPSRPSAPGGATATASDGTASVSWQRPVDDGGSPIIEYTVTASPGGASVTVDAPSLQANVTGLTNGTAYSFTVTARNAVGASAPSAPSQPVTPRGSAEKPSPPTGITAAPQDGAAVVAWQKPPEGSSPITSYTVLASPGGAAAIVRAPQLEATVTGLDNGTAYTFTVTATSAVGTSDPSEPSEAVVAGRAPQPPTNLIASASDGTATVTWTPPLDPGTSPITGYTVLETGTRETVTVHGQETATFAGLTNGTSYSFQVKATNATGTSKYSTSSSPVIPREPKPPGQPFITTTHGRDGEVELSWSPPPTGAAGVDRYRVRVEPGGRTQETAAGVTTAVVKDLANGTGYTFTVTAINGNGDGQPSILARATPKAGRVPLGPTLLEAAPRDGRIDLRWLPTRDGGSPVTGYKATAEPGGASVTVAGDATTAALTGLTNGTAYTVELTAVNGTGTSGVTVREGLTPIARRPPQPPGNVTAAATGEGEAQVAWSPPTDTGTAPIQRYTVTTAPGEHTASTTSCETGRSTCAVTVGGLDPSVEYTFTVTATSADGTGGAAPATRPITPELTMATQPWELSPAAAQALTEADDDGTLVFADAPQEVVDLTPGRYLVVPQSSAAPNGLIRKITQVRTAGTAVTLSTMPAAIEDLIDEGGFSGALTLGAADLVSGPAGSQQRGSTRSDGFSPDPISVSFSRDVGQNGRIDADLTLTPKLTYEARLRNRKLTGRVSVTANLSGHVRLHTDRKETWSRQIPLGKWTFRKMVGIGRFKIPLTFTTILAAKVHADASGAVTLEARHDIDAGMTAEIDGKRADFTPTFTNRTTVGRPELDGSASARVDASASTSSRSPTP